MTAPTIPADLAAWCSANDARAQDELFAFLRIPSVSARSEHKADCAAAAQFVADALTRIGLTTTIEPTPGHPIVVGEWRGAGPDAQPQSPTADALHRGGGEGGHLGEDGCAKVTDSLSHVCHMYVSRVG